MIASLSLSKYGLTRSLRWLLGTSEATIAQFKNQKTRMFVDFKGMCSANHTPVSGCAEVLDVQNKTQDELIALIPPNVLVSGRVDLPIDLKIIFPTKIAASSSFKTMEQVGDSLILNFAAKEEIEGLSLDESFKIREQQDLAEKQRLKAEMASVRAQMRKLNSEDDGLTALGRQLLNKEKDQQEKQTKQAELIARLNSLNVLFKDLELKIKKRRFWFEGGVSLRFI